MTSSDLIFWYTGATIWGMIAIVLFVVVLLGIICGAISGYFRAARWFTIYLLYRWIDYPRARRTEVFKQLRDFAHSWIHAGYFEGRKDLTAKQFEQCVDQLGFFFLKRRGGWFK